MKLIIVRGLPGSGKSTFAQTFPFTVHLEADMFFLNDVGEYKFDSQLLGRAHTWCQETTKILLRSGNSVIVSNTFTTMKEINPYLDIAKNIKGCTVEVYRTTKNYGSVHNVPKEAIQRMADRFVDYPGEVFI